MNRDKKKRIPYGGFEFPPRELVASMQGLGSNPCRAQVEIGPGTRFRNDPRSRLYSCKAQVQIHAVPSLRSTEEAS